MKNVFSTNELTPELEPAFATQAEAQAGGVPIAPSTPATLSANHPVPLRLPMFETAAENAGDFLDWKRTPIQGD